jgi:hypothetical protein
MQNKERKLHCIPSEGLHALKAKIHIQNIQDMLELNIADCLYLPQSAADSLLSTILEVNSDLKNNL